MISCGPCGDSSALRSPHILANTLLGLPPPQHSIYSSCVDLHQAYEGSFHRLGHLVLLGRYVQSGGLHRGLNHSLNLSVLERSGSNQSEGQERRRRVASEVDHGRGAQDGAGGI